VASVAVAMALVGASGTARGDGADASGSFDYGLSEMLAGRYATGCPALESSFRLDPRAGTLFTLADCDRKWGKTASALARFEEYLALYERMPAEERAKGRERERATIATTERATLERTVPLLAVRLPNDAPAGTRVWRDDVELTGPALAAKVPVDPGEHRVRMETPDGRSVEQTISVEGGEERTLVVALPAAGAETAPVAPRPETALAAMAPSATPHSSASSARPSHVGWAYATAGIGVASLAVAGITGGIALSQRSETSSVCNAAGVCVTERGVKAGNEARTMADVETGALVVGGVAVAAAIVLWLTEPRARRTSLVWTPGGVTAVW
jgi:hypothetical protein